MGFTKPALLESRLKLRLPRFLRDWLWLRLRDFQRLRLRDLPELRLCNQFFFIAKDAVGSLQIAWLWLRNQGFSFLTARLRSMSGYNRWRCGWPLNSHFLKGAIVIYDVTKPIGSEVKGQKLHHLHYHIPLLLLKVETVVYKIRSLDKHFVGLVIYLHFYV